MTQLYLSAFSGAALRAKAPFPLSPSFFEPTIDGGTLVLGPVPGPDAGTTAEGLVRLEEGEPIEGALVAVSTDYDLLTTTSGADGSFSLAGVPALDGLLFATAEALREGALVTVQASGEEDPVPGGTTDLGALELPDGGGAGGG